jgi:uncharacterized membrane protein
MVQWLYKWLPIICGCHCRPDRSFYFRGKQFPVCARCTGFLIGFILAAVAYAFYHISSVPILVLMLIPMIVDGTIQKKTSYESNNFKRVVTGFLFGYAILTLLIIVHVAGFKFGVQLGINIKN